MNGQDTTWLDVPGPATVVGECRVEAVAAINEDHGQRGLPVACGRSGTRNHGYYGVVEASALDVVAKRPERVYLRHFSIIECRVVEHLALLVLLRAAVVVQREHGAAIFVRRQSQIQRGLAAIAAYFQNRACQAAGLRPAIQRLRFVRVQEALDGVDVRR